MAVKKLSADFIVVGAGIIGLAIGREILLRNPKMRVIILEKESEVGFHASGRNSGVLHAGFYYSPESLKAKFCRDGNHELKQIIRKHKIPILECGKVVVSRNEQEDIHLEGLYDRGIANGVNLEFLKTTDLASIEEKAKTFRNFIWSPTTAVSEPARVIIAMKKEFEKLGGEIFFSTKIKTLQPLLTESHEINFQHLINAAGAFSDSIAHSFGFGLNYKMMPFLGSYKQTKVESNFKRLIYPVPHPVNPFLGVHFTISTDGYLKIGPTALPLIGREQYNLYGIKNFHEPIDFVINISALIRGKYHDLSKMSHNELPKILTRNLIKEAETLLNVKINLNGWTSKRPGIRSQLIDRKSGKLEQDFIIVGDDQTTHVLNAVSPGWTSAIPFGKHVVDGILNKRLHV